MPETTHNHSKLNTALIGMTGGLCLVLLKLIEKSFFFGEADTNKVYAGLLTYAAYIIFGIIVAMFFTDEELPPGKHKKNALIMGLLAPTILLTVINNPNTEVDKGGKVQNIPTLTTFVVDKIIPSLGEILVGKAYASEEEKNTTSIKLKDVFEEVPFTVKTTNPSIDDLKLKFSDALKSSVGLSQSNEKWAYMVGMTTDEDIALNTAVKLNTLLRCQKDENLENNCVDVINPKGSDVHYISIGGIGLKNEVQDWKAAALTISESTLSEYPTIESFEAARLLPKGQIIKGVQLFQ